MSERARWAEATDEKVTAGFLDVLDGYRDAMLTAFQQAPHVSIGRHQLDSIRVDAARAAVVSYVARLEQRYVTFVDRATTEPNGAEEEAGG